MRTDFSTLLTLEVARVKQQLSAEGYKVKLRETTPPHENKRGLGKKRTLVIKQVRPEEVVVIWSFENFK